MIASVVVTSREDAVAHVAAALSVADGVEPGKALGVRIPVVVEASGSAELRGQLEAIEALDGVERVDLVMFQFPSQHEEQAQ